MPERGFLMFFKSAFERRVKELADRSSLKIADLNSRRARLLFTIGEHTQPLWIVPYGEVWEFSCPSIIAAEDADDIPKPVLVAVLERNAQKKRGFWCIETIGGKKTLEFMHNIPEGLLTPDEFRKICWSVVKEVEALEGAFIELLRRLL